MATQDTNKDLQCKEQQSEDEELAEFTKKLSTAFDVLPLFEKDYNTFVRTRHYSMTTNEKLRTRWHERVISEKKPSGPKTMPNINDYHFHNCRTKFLPSESQSNYPPPGFNLAPGPGVDRFGQRPIPDDMLMKVPNANSSQPSPSKKHKVLKERQRHQAKKF